MFHPSRGGVRGGQDQFTWDSVKEDRYRECYLGHSVMAPVGRWQKGKDLQWYAKDGDKHENDQIAQRKREELIAVKQAEEDAMAEALGLKKRNVTESDVSNQELQSVLRKEQEYNEEDNVESTAAVKGLGFKHFANTGAAVIPTTSAFVSTGRTSGRENPEPTKSEVQNLPKTIRELDRLERKEQKEEKRKRKEMKKAEKDERRRLKEERKCESKVKEEETSPRDGERRRGDRTHERRNDDRDRRDRSGDRRDERRFEESQRNSERRSRSRSPAWRTRRGDRRATDRSQSPAPHRSRYRSRSRSRSPFRSRGQDSQRSDFRNQKTKVTDDRYAERDYRRDR